MHVINPTIRRDAGMGVKRCTGRAVCHGLGDLDVVADADTPDPLGDFRPVAGAWGARWP